MAEQAIKLATIDDLMKLPDRQRADLLNGQIVLQASPSPQHAFIQRELVSQLTPNNANFKNGSFDNGWVFLVEAGVFFDERHAFQHDIAGWRAEILPRLPQENYVKITPNWVCEITSTNWRMDTHHKRAILQRYGVRHYWLLRPSEKSLTVLRLVDSGYLLVETYGAEDGSIIIEPFANPLDLTRLFAY